MAARLAAATHQGIPTVGESLGRLIPALVRPSPSDGAHWWNQKVTPVRRQKLVFAAGCPRERSASAAFAPACTIWQEGRALVPCAKAALIGSLPLTGNLCYWQHRQS